MKDAVRVLLLLTGDHARRLLRQGIVLRSLVFPVGLAVLTVLATVGVVTWLRPPHRVALTPEVATAALAAEVEEGGFQLLITPDPAAAVADEDAVIGTDGRTLWLGGGANPPVPLEAAVRRHVGAAWRPHHPSAARARHIQQTDAPRDLAMFIGALFALYGVVFGAGGVARDRDEGTLDAELSLAVPHVVHGLARWLAGTLVLAGFYGVSVALLHALMGVGDPVVLALHGLAAAGGATAIGLLVIGRAGLDKGFAGPMSAGLVAVFSLFSVGFANQDLGAWLPVGSLVVADAPPGPPLGVAAVAGLLAAVMFARRTAVS